MDESILTSVKKMLVPEEDYEHFDPDLIVHINSVLATLNQLDVGPDNGFSFEIRRLSGAISSATIS